ncbi:MAG: AAA family ATPase [Nitrospirae bacterium]|nr:AAA family ATPase [Nitrospirota bacterium]
MKCGETILDVYIIAGPNGSGKTTFAKDFMNVRGLQYINADDIARELNPHDVDSVRIKAARLFFAQIDKCMDEGVSFIIEITLAGKNFLKLERLKSLGYRVHDDLYLRGCLRRIYREDCTQGKEWWTSRPR